MTYPNREYHQQQIRAARQQLAQVAPEYRAEAQKQLDETLANALPSGAALYFATGHVSMGGPSFGAFGGTRDEAEHAVVVRLTEYAQEYSDWRHADRFLPADRQDENEIREYFGISAQLVECGKGFELP